jgi:hypothetical protein
VHAVVKKVLARFGLQGLEEGAGDPVRRPALEAQLDAQGGQVEEHTVLKRHGVGVGVDHVIGSEETVHHSGW